jgi:hypothetical protein
MTYAEKLKDPRWQRRRLELLEAANWKCCECEAADKTLHVHHNFYRSRTQPWDYPAHAYRVLCEDCHSAAESQRRELSDLIEQQYENDHDIAAIIGFLKANKMLCSGGAQNATLRGFGQLWGFAKFFEGDPRDLKNMLKNRDGDWGGDVAFDDACELWRDQFERFTRRMASERVRDEREQGAVV